jgi:hypothetical protein
MRTRYSTILAILLLTTIAMPCLGGFIETFDDQDYADGSPVTWTNLDTDDPDFVSDGDGGYYIRAESVHPTYQPFRLQTANPLNDASAKNVGSWQFDSHIDQARDANYYNVLWISVDDAHAAYYGINHNGDGSVSLIKRVNATSSALISGSVADDDGWHTFKATRDALGNWELFADGTSQGTAQDTTMTDLPYLTVGRYVDIDNVIVVPEPAGAVLLAGVALLALLARKRCRG